MRVENLPAISICLIFFPALGGPLTWSSCSRYVVVPTRCDALNAWNALGPRGAGRSPRAGPLARARGATVRRSTAVSSGDPTAKLPWIPSPRRDAHNIPFQNRWTTLLHSRSIACARGATAHIHLNEHSPRLCGTLPRARRPHRAARRVATEQKGRNLAGISCTSEFLSALTSTAQAKSP